MRDLDDNEINLRAPQGALAQTSMTCPRCGVATKAYGLFVAAGHAILDDEDVSLDAARGDGWTVVGVAALVFEVEYLPAALALRLRQLAPTWVPGTATGHGECWVNHCEHCRAPLADTDLFCEPGGAFVPMDAGSAAHIEFESLGGIEARAAGHAYAPEFLPDRHCGA